MALCDVTRGNGSATGIGKNILHQGKKLKNTMEVAEEQTLNIGPLHTMTQGSRPNTKAHQQTEKKSQ